MATIPVLEAGGVALAGAVALSPPGSSQDGCPLRCRADTPHVPPRSLRARRAGWSGGPRDDRNRHDLKPAGAAVPAAAGTHEGADARACAREAARKVEFASSRCSKSMATGVRIRPRRVSEHGRKRAT